MSARHYIDGHVHIGRAEDGSLVKIAAAPGLSVHAILEEAAQRKGLDIVGVIDAAATPVMADIERLAAEGHLAEHRNGGLRFEDRVTLILGAEVEVPGPSGGAAHFGVFVPDLRSLRELNAWLRRRQTNAALSSQRLIGADANDLGRLCADLEGIFVVNHAFTPHKGLYGSCVPRLAEMVDPAFVTAVELGLSADTEMADRVSELHAFTFVTNSDAHSLRKIAREYQVAELTEPSFAAYKNALLRQGADRITANAGLWPRLGKYHLSACARCGFRFQDPDADRCPECGSRRIVRGVEDRLKAVMDLPGPRSPSFRPPYIHQVPLEFIPGLGPQTMRRLLAVFGTEMRILQEVPAQDLIACVGERLGHVIDLARTGSLAIDAGAGGRYGRPLIPV